MHNYILPCIINLDFHDFFKQRYRSERYSRRIILAKFIPMIHLNIGRFLMIFLGQV